MAGEHHERSPARRHATGKLLALLSLEAWALAYLVVIAPLGPSGLLALVDTNRVEPGVRRALVLVPFATALVVRVALGIAALRSAAVEAQLGRVAAGLALALVAWVLPPLFVRETFAGSELLLVALIGGVALALERTSARARDAFGSLLDPVRAGVRRLPASVPAVLAAAWLCGMLTFGCLGSIRIHDKMLTSNFDLGIFENVFFNTLHGRPGIGLERAYFAEHAELLLYALLPLYALFPRAETLLVIQAALVVGAGVPLYLLAKRWLDSRWHALALLGVYLAHPAVHGPLFYDFHFLPLSAFFLLWAAFFHTARKLVPFWVAIVLAMSCREDVALGVALVGIGLFVIRRCRSTALPLLVLGSAWFVVVKLVWMRRFGAETFSEYYDALIPKGTAGFSAVLRTVLSNPLFTLQKTLTEDKLLLGLHLFAPLAFLPLRQARTLPLLLPGLVVVGLATSRSAVSQVHFHYAMHFVPYAMIATVAALASRPRPRRTPLVLAMLVASGLATVHYGAFLGNSFHTSFHDVSFGWDAEDARRRDAFRALVARVPADASVAAGEHEGPQVARRAHLFALKEGLGDARFVLYSTRSLRWGGKDEIQRALTKGTYGVVDRREGLTLLERGAGTSKNSEESKRLKNK